MSAILREVLSANAAYTSTFGDKADLPLPPGRSFAILTCMDARLDPAKYAGLSEGDAHVIRNAGGRASDDAIRSLVISYKLLGRRNGLSYTTRIVAWSIDWLAVSDRTGAVVDDVRRVRAHPLVPKTIPIYGYIYDVKSGKLVEVPEATEAGK